MREERVTFFSDGLRLSGRWFLPEGGAGTPGLPIVIVLSGYTGLVDQLPAMVARSLTARGYPCFGFDFRGWGESEGDPDQVLLEEQQRDIVYAAAYCAARGEAEGRKVVVAGWGMAAGLAIKAARLQPDIAGLIAMNGFVNNRRVQEALRGADGWSAFQEFLRREFRRHALDGAAGGYAPFSVYPLDPATTEELYHEGRAAADNTRRQGPGGGFIEPPEVSLSFACSLIDFEIEGDLSMLAARPLLIVHGHDNALHPAGEAEALAAHYPGPNELLLLEGAKHLDWMEPDAPAFRRFLERLDRWVKAQGLGRAP
ncbi:MAG: alpha/beta hydrolase [Pseudomonadota bacterium]